MKNFIVFILFVGINLLACKFEKENENKKLKEYIKKIEQILEDSKLLRY